MCQVSLWHDPAEQTVGQGQPKQVIVLANEAGELQLEQPTVDGSYVQPRRIAQVIRMPAASPAHRREHRGRLSGHPRCSCRRRRRGFWLYAFGHSAAAFEPVGELIAALVKEA